MKNIVEERDLLLSKDKKFLSIMGCMISLMLIVGMCVFTFSYHDKISELMISGNEGGTTEKEVYAMAEDAFAYDIKTGKTVGITKKEAKKLEIRECISIINDENKAVSVFVK